MGLVISLRISDGIVVVTDSLATSQNIIELLSKNIQAKRPSCKKKINIQNEKIPPLPIPFSASSYTQKLLKLGDNFLISLFGIGIINNKSVISKAKCMIHNLTYELFNNRC